MVSFATAFLTPFQSIIPSVHFDLLGKIGTEEELNLLKNDASERDRPSRRTCSIYDGALFTADDFTAGRAAWRATLFGTEGENDPDIPGMTNLLAMRDADSDALRAEMNRGPNACILLGSEALDTSRELKQQYDRILRMAQPYGIFGCRRYHDDTLLQDILYTMGWMYDHMYGENALTDSSYRSWHLFNWLECFVGGACPTMNTVMIIADQPNKAQIAKYTLPSIICTPKWPWARKRA